MRRSLKTEKSKVAFNLTITEAAEAQLHSLPARDQRILEAAILARLTDQPTKKSKSIKRLRSNAFAEFELRAGDLRVLYNVEGDEVVLLLVGRKAGNKLIVDGEEFHGHRSNPSEPTGGEPAGDAQ